MSKKYYRLDNIQKLNAVYNMIISQRLSGKTYSILEKLEKVEKENKELKKIIKNLVK